MHCEAFLLYPCRVVTCRPISIPSSFSSQNPLDFRNDTRERKTPLLPLVPHRAPSSCVPQLLSCHSRFVTGQRSEEGQTIQGKAEQGWQEAQTSSYQGFRRCAAQNRCVVRCLRSLLQWAALICHMFKFYLPSRRVTDPVLRSAPVAPRKFSAARAQIAKN